MLHNSCSDLKIKYGIFGEVKKTIYKSLGFLTDFLSKTKLLQKNLRYMVNFQTKFVKSPQNGHGHFLSQVKVNQFG